MSSKLRINSNSQKIHKIHNKMMSTMAATITIRERTIRRIAKLTATRSCARWRTWCTVLLLESTWCTKSKDRFLESSCYKHKATTEILRMEHLPCLLLQHYRYPRAPWWKRPPTNRSSHSRTLLYHHSSLQSLLVGQAQGLGLLNKWSRSEWTY